MCYSDDRTLPHSSPQHGLGRQKTPPQRDVELRVPSTCPLGKDTFFLVQDRDRQQSTTHKFHQVGVSPLLGVGWMPKFCPKSLYRGITASCYRRRVVPEIYSQSVRDRCCLITVRWGWKAGFYPRSSWPAPTGREMDMTSFVGFILRIGKDG